MKKLRQIVEGKTEAFYTRDKQQRLKEKPLDPTKS